MPYNSGQRSALASAYALDDMKNKFWKIMLAAFATISISIGCIGLTARPMKETTESTYNRPFSGENAKIMSNIGTADPLLYATSEYYQEFNGWPKTETEIKSFISESQLPFDLSKLANIRFEELPKKTVRIYFTMLLSDGPLGASITITGEEIKNLPPLPESQKQ